MEPLRKAFTEWQSKLLQLDRKNALLYFKTQTGVGKPKTGIVRLQSDDLDGLFLSLTDTDGGLAFPYAERKKRRAAEPVGDEAEDANDPMADEQAEIYAREGDISILDCTLLELQKRLRGLRKKVKEFEQEQGINVLYLAFGFLHWIDEQEKDGVAPLLLLACDLEAESLKDNIRLVAESDDLLVNVTLKHKLHTLEFELPEFDHDTDTIDSYLSKCELALCKGRAWTIKRDVYLSTFSYSKIAMWEDLQRMSVGDFTTPALQALSGADLVLKTEIESSAITDSFNDSDFAGAKLDDELDDTKQFLVLPADYSQVMAVEAGRSGCHLIIHGPPGTGKSQTIANLIGTLMADGKTVLFVSEKSAALDVVKRRLEKCGLGSFCIDLHGRRAKKDAFYDQLRTSVEDERLVKENKFPYHQLSQYRRELTELARVLHKTREPLKSSVYRMHGEYAKVRDEIDVPFDVVNEAYLPQKLDEGKFRKVIELAERLSKRGAQFIEHFDSKWMPLKNTQAIVRLSDDLRKNLTSLSENIIQLSEHARVLSQAMGIDCPKTLQTNQELAKFFVLMTGCPGVPRHWLSNVSVARIRTVVNEKRDDYARLRKLQEQTTPIWGSELPLVNFRSDKNKMELVSAQGENLKCVLGLNWKDRILIEAKPICLNIEQCLVALSSLKQKLSELSSQLGIVAPCTRKEIDGALHVAQQVILIEKIPEGWFDITSHREFEKFFASSEATLLSLIAEEKSLFEHYRESIIDKIDEQMRIRFIADYDGFLAPFLKRKQFQADVQIIRLEHRTTIKPTREEAIWVIDRALNIKKLRAEWANLEESLRKRLGSLFDDRDTDWTRIKADFGKVKNLFSSGQVETVRVRDILANDVRIREFKKLTSEVCDVLSHIDHLIALIAGGTGSVRFDAELQSLQKLFVQTKDPIYCTSQVIESWNLADKNIGDLDQLCALAVRCVEQVELKAALESQAELLQSDLHDRFKGETTDWLDVDKALNWAEAYLPQSPLSSSDAILRQIETPKDSFWYKDAELKLKTASDNLTSVFAKLDVLFDTTKTNWDDWTSADFEELKAWAEMLIPSADDAPDWIVYRRLCDELDEEFGSPVVQRVREETENATKFPSVVRRKLVSDWLEHVYLTETCLRDFAGLDQEDLVNKFRKLDQNLSPEAAREEIQRRVYGRYPVRQATGEGSSDMPRLQSELSKKKRRMSIRRLLERLPQLLKTLKPCFFMSPLSVSQHLPSVESNAEGQFFDVLIFDEASQIFPEDAVPAIARCKQIIVVGDDKQLPPTSFFRAGEDASWEDFESDEEENNALIDTESILSALKQFIGRGVYERYLKVHYRSRHDSLIQFSNYHFYDKKLLVFPSPSRNINELGLCDVYESEGRFDSGGTQTNRKEAERVVELVVQHMRNTRKDQSLGVVTLSMAQANLIESLINIRKQNEPDIAYRFNEGGGEEFFVKNLERVQGDERDHIILCIGYGPTVGTGKSMNRFGPINSPMGPRRLNVAITRARDKLTLVRSLHASDITAEGAGARLLKSFIEYAQDPVRHFEKQVIVSADATPDSSFEIAVKNALEARGYKVQPQVGVAGFRIDLAIVSEDGHHYDLGIECDGIQYHSSPSARDRDWLRQSILEELGWGIHRIWSTSWIRNPEQELNRIETALQASRSHRLRPSVPV